MAESEVKEEGESVERELTPMQERFCQELQVDRNQTQAAIRAGYSEHTAAEQASRLLTNVKVIARDNELKAERSKRTEITADYVLGTLTELVERCMQKAPVMVKRGKHMVQLQDEEGRDVWRFDSAGANAALALLGKHLKLFTEKVEHTGKDGAPIQFHDQEAAARLAAILNAARTRKDSEPKA